MYVVVSHLSFSINGRQKKQANITRSMHPPVYAEKINPNTNGGIYIGHVGCTILNSEHEFITALL